MHFILHSTSLQKDWLLCVLTCNKKNAHLNTENYNTFIYIMTSNIRYNKIIHTGGCYASCFTPLPKKETIQFFVSSIKLVLAHWPGLPGPINNNDITAELIVGCLHSSGGAQFHKEVSCWQLYIAPGGFKRPGEVRSELKEPVLREHRASLLLPLV